MYSSSLICLIIHLSSMHALCHQVISDIVEIFMQKIGSSGQQNATRCGLWWVEMLRTRDQYKEAATVYFRICNEVMPHVLEITLVKFISFAPDNFYILGTFTFSCYAWASILLLFVVKATNVKQVWFSSCSFWRSL